MPRTKILGLGSYVPERIVDNEELPFLDDQHRRQPTRQTETDDSWIQRRTGIRTRRYVPSDGSTVCRRRRAISLVVARHASELEQRALYAAAQRRHRLRQTDRRPLPIRVRQHEHAQQVHERLAGDRDRELGRVSEVGLRDGDSPVRVRASVLDDHTSLCPWLASRIAMIITE